MGRKKDKTIKRVVAFYQSVFKFLPPLNILIDGNFFASLYKKKMEIKSELSKVLNQIVNLVITPCVVNELKQFETIFPGITNNIVKFKLHDCNHQSNPDIKTPSDCILDLLGNKNKDKYYVATLDINLRKIIRKNVPICPVIFLDQSVIMIEKPSKDCMSAYNKREELKSDPIKNERKFIKESKAEAALFMKEEYMKSNHFKKKLEEEKILKLMGAKTKKAKAPNPLSIMKKVKKIKKLNNEDDDNNEKMNDKEDKIQNENKNLDISYNNENTLEIENISNEENTNEINTEEMKDKPRRVRKRNKMKRYMDRLKKRNPSLFL